ncbi:hypothetical protein U9M48_016805 [Paspalum notatum var. saurae]|uniref:Uncharacterized protein n=1 Tax=Paspalum notatum var. saurae TaxID=547442 RepID=A0AAQ3WNJ6_PASNO
MEPHIVWPGGFRRGGKAPHRDMATGVARVARSTTPRLSPAGARDSAPIRGAAVPDSEAWPWHHRSTGIRNLSRGLTGGHGPFPCRHDATADVPVQFLRRPRERLHGATAGAMEWHRSAAGYGSNY